MKLEGFHTRTEPGVRVYFYLYVPRLLYKREFNGGRSEVEVLVQLVSRNNGDAVQCSRSGEPT